MREKPRNVKKEKKLKGYCRFTAHNLRLFPCSAKWCKCNRVVKEKKVFKKPPIFEKIVKDFMTKINTSSVEFGFFFFWVEKDKKGKEKTLPRPREILYYMTKTCRWNVQAV